CNSEEAALEVEQFGVDPGPVDGVVDVPGVRVLTLEEAVRLDCVERRFLRRLVVGAGRHNAIAGATTISRSDRGCAPCRAPRRIAASSDPARAGHRPLAEELDAAAITAEHEAETHSTEHLGDAGAALGAGCGLVEKRAVHRLDVKVYRLVFASHRIPPTVVATSLGLPANEDPITKRDSGDIAMPVACLNCATGN